MTTLHNTLFALTIAAFTFSGMGVNAATISYVGSDTTTNADWRSTGVVKPANLDLATLGDTLGSDGDPSGDNAYGTDGYHVYTTAVFSSLPGYITSSTVLAPLVFGHSSYADYDDPTLAIASAVVDTDANVIYYASQTTGQESDFFEIVVADSTPFLLGVIVDNWNGTGSLPLSLRVRQTVGGSADSGQNLTLAGSDDQNVDYYFFRVEGSAGDTFVLSMVNDGGHGNNILNGIFFEQVPEPSAFGLALVGLLGMSLRRRRRARG